jgi:DNA-binding CsgD family transcriptional regulator
MNPAAANAPSDGCDSFDEHLDWILEKLNDRAGGSFGVIVRFIEGVETPAIMARTAETAVLTNAAFARITLELRSSIDIATHSGKHELTVSGPLSLPGVTGSIRILQMTFRPAPGIFITAAVCRPESSFALLHSLVAHRLQPVLDRYFRLWWMHRTERRRADAFENAIEHAELGVALLDRRGQVLYANAYVQKIIDEGDGMRGTVRGIAPTDPANALRLQAAIQHALQCNLECGQDNGWQAPLVLLNRGERERALIVTILPHRQRAMDPDDAAAIVYVLHPEREVHRCLAPVFRIYGLTSAESRLVTEMVKGANLNEVADLMSVSLGTVRAQLKQVFEKTRTNRQSELVRVMLASAMRSTIRVDLSLV